MNAILNMLKNSILNLHATGTLMNTTVKGLRGCSREEGMGIRGPHLSQTSCPKMVSSALVGRPSDAINPSTIPALGAASELTKKLELSFLMKA